MADRTLSLTLQLNGLAQVENGLKRFFGTFELGARGLEKSTGIVGALARGLSELAGPIAAGASIVGMVELTRRSLEFSEAIGKASKIAGMSVTEMVGIAYAANQDEVGLKELGVALKTFSKYLVETGQSGKSIKEALLEQAAIFQRLPDGVLKSARAVAMFGREGERLIPLLSKGPDELQALFARGGRLSGITNELSESAEKFGDAFKDFKLASVSLAGTLVSDLLPALTKTLNTVTDLIVNFREWSKQSEAFSVAKDAVGPVVGAGATAYLGSRALSGITNLVGPINSLSDLGVAITLIGTRALAAASTIALAAGAIAGAIAIIVAGNEYRKMMQATREQEESSKNFEARNAELSKSILKVIDLREKEGKIAADQAERLRGFVNAAMQHPANADGRLGVISRYLNSQTEKSDAAPQKIWTAEELEIANKALDTEIARVNVLREKGQLNIDSIARTFEQNAALKDLAKQEDFIYQKRDNAFEALNQNAITQVQYDELDLKAKQELLAVDRERKSIQDQIRQDQVNAIRSDFTKSDAEKYRELAPLARNERELKALGPNPDSLKDQLLATRANLATEFGTLSQQIAQGFSNTILAAVNSISQALTGLIEGTKTWGQALREIGTSILDAVIQSIARMFVTWIVNMLVLKALQKVIGTDSKQQASDSAAAWAPAAVAASIASYGAAAAVGTAAAIAGMAVGAVFAGALAGGGGGYAEGGYTGPGGKYDIAGIVHRGEVVWSQADVARAGGVANVELLRHGSNVGLKDPSINFKPEVHVHNWDSEYAYKKFLRENPDAQHILFNLLKKNQWKFRERRD